VLIRVPDVESAVAALAEPRTQAVAGATALLVDVHRAAPAPGATRALVDLTSVPELCVLDEAVPGEAPGVRFGAAVTLARAARRPGVVGAAAAGVATLAVRHQATIGGNACAAAWPADLVAALWCAGATVEVADPHGRRHLELGLAPLSLAPGEIVVALRVPDERGTHVAGGGVTPTRPALRVLTGLAAGRAVATAGAWRHPLPSTGAAVAAHAALHPAADEDEAAAPADGGTTRAASAAFVGAVLAAELGALGVPAPVAADLARRTALALEDV